MSFIKIKFEKSSSVYLDRRMIYHRKTCPYYMFVNKKKQGANFTTVYQLYSQYAYVIISFITCRAKLWIHSQTSTAQSLNFGNGQFNFTLHFTGHMISYPCWELNSFMSAKGPKVARQYVMSKYIHNDKFTKECQQIFVKHHIWLC